MVSPDFIREAQSVASEAAFLYLLEITTPGNPILRLVNNAEPIISRGLTYEAAAFDAVLPQDDAEQLPTITLTIANVSPEIMATLRAFKEPPQIKIELVSSLTPDIVERTLDFLKLRGVEYDAFTISGKMDVVNILALRFGDTYNPVQFPGLFVI